MPVSFNEIPVSAIIGSELAVAGGDGVSPRKLGLTVASRVGSFVLAFMLDYGSTVRESGQVSVNQEV